MKQIDTETFRDCTALRVIELSEGLEIIGGYVFKGCNALEKIVIPASVKQIELEAFQDGAGSILCESNFLLVGNYLYKRARRRKRPPTGELFR